MQKNLLILCGLLLMISFPTAKSFGQTWSAPNYHPEIGDRIVKVNGNYVYDESDFRYEVRNSSQNITLRVVDPRTGQYYSLRTQLWPASYQTRLGIYVRTAPNHNGVIVTGFWPNCPGMRCQYKKGEITPVHDGWYY